MFSNALKTKYKYMSDADVIAFSKDGTLIKTDNLSNYYQESIGVADKRYDSELFIDLEVQVEKISSNATAFINWYGKELSKVKVYDAASAMNQKAKELMESAMVKKIKLINPKTKEEVFAYDFCYQGNDAVLSYLFKKRQSSGNSDRMEILNMFSFGGFYKKGISIDAMEQVFIQLIRSPDDKVKIYPTKRSFWEDSGCSLSEGGIFRQNKVIFPDFHKKPYQKTLAQEIRNGGIEISLMDMMKSFGGNEEGRENKNQQNSDVFKDQRFTSCDFVVLSDNMIRVNLKAER